MPYDIDPETAETKSGKPVKRVRFSDEVQNVYDFERSEENSGSISMENENNDTFINSPFDLESSEFYSKKSMESNGNEDGKTINEDVLGSITDSYSDNINELTSYYAEEENEPVSSYSDDIISQDSENSYNDAQESIPTGSNNEKNDLDELISDTMHMTISPTISDTLFNNFTSSGEPVPYSSLPEANPESVVEFSEQKNSMNGMSRKRSLKGMFIGRQTSKLNICLRKNNSEINSADELKNAVYDAWCKVKNEKLPAPTSHFNSEEKKVFASQKSLSLDSYETWKRSKRKVKKVNPSKKMSNKTTKPAVKTKEEIEESKMAFRAWKKKKDELLRHQLAEKYQKEEKERLDALMNERIRKNDAESAYLAWNAHKSVAIKMEKKKNQWLLEKEKEKLEMKMKKNEEAEKIYYDWLRNKVYSSRNSNYKMIQDKPPWTPPGKTNNFI